MKPISLKVLSVISTKGGVGKTTTAANLGALYADAGKRVLLIDTDIQPTLSSYFKLEHEAPGGIYELLGMNDTRPEQIVSRTDIPDLHIIKSNDDQNQLGSLLLNAADGRLRLFNLLSNFSPDYDLIVIDTQGARSVIQEMALLASTIALSPVVPEALAARELLRWTMKLFNDLQSYARLGIHIPPLKVFINRADVVSTDARMISSALRGNFSSADGVSVLATAVPAIASYRSAATQGMPAHRYETKRPSGRKAPAALETMTELAAEIIPEWKVEIDALSVPVERSVADDDREGEQ